MDDFASHASGMRRFQERLGNKCPKITWSGADYQVMPGGAVRRKDLSPGGFQLNADFQFKALVDQFLSDSIPDVTTLKDSMLQTAVGYLDDTYKVESVAIHPGGYVITVDCNSINQRA